MTRIFGIVLACLICALSGFGLEQSTNQQHGNRDRDLNELKAKRIKLLQQRVEVVNKLVQKGTASPYELVDPKIELIRIQIEYADSKEEKRALFDELLIQHDLRIDRHKTMSRATISTTKSLVQLLHLQSERLRVEIESHSFD